MVCSARAGRVVWAVCLTMGLGAATSVALLHGEETLEERRARIERMDADEKAEIRRAQQQFAALDRAEQKRLVDLHDRIAAHERSEDLLRVMERYCQWMNSPSLSLSERAELQALAPAERIEKIKEIRDEHARRRQFARGGRGSFSLAERFRKLSLEQREGLVRWLDRYMDRNATALIERLPKDQREKLREELDEAKDDRRRRRGVFIEIWALWQMHTRGEPVPLTDEDLKALRSQLSPDAREWLGKIRPHSQRRVLAGMMGALVFTQHHEALSDYLEKELSPRERDMLTSLPPEQMRQMLWWRYLNSKWPGMLPGPGRGRPGGPFPPRPDGSRATHRRFDRGGPSPSFPPGHRHQGPKPPDEDPNADHGPPPP